MSIPLDRLYHYLKTLSNEDIIIYRWSPHGSKKLEDLTPTEDRDELPLFDKVLENNIICHDQEPLQYNLYSQSICLAKANQLAQERIDLEEKNTNLPKYPWCRSEHFLNFISTTHLRLALDPIFNLHDRILLCHSEKNSKELEIYESNGFIGVYYWSHALIARDWFRYAEHDSNLDFDVNNVKNDFLIYNRAWSGTREYRLKFAELLLENNLENFANIKFSQFDNGIHYTAHNFANPDLAITRQDIEKYIDHNLADSGASADYVADDYSSSAIEVVLETLFDDSRHHLTEKILRPIACGCPFILVGTPGCLQYLRDYGFKTFNGLINEDYDSIADPALRLTEIVKEMKRISNLDAVAKKNLWIELYKIANYNQQRFFSPEFHVFVSNEFSVNVNAAIQESKKYITGKWANAFVNPEITGSITPTSKLFEQVTDWLEKNDKLGLHYWPTVQ